MEERALYSDVTAAELAIDYLSHHDQEVMQALVAVGALVALSDGLLDDVERDALANFVDLQGFVSTISRREIAKAFDISVRQIQRGGGASPVVEALRPLAGLSLASLVVRTAGRVAAADRKIHPGELRALKMIRLIMMTLPPLRRMN
jgi:tellurite resistance protein